MEIMTERIKELLLSTSLEDNWLAVEIMRIDKPDSQISREISDLVKHDFHLVIRYFKISRIMTRGRTHRTIYRLRENINDY